MVDLLNRIFFLLNGVLNKKDVVKYRSGTTDSISSALFSINNLLDDLGGAIDTIPHCL